jgi:hypothetical protein
MNVKGNCATSILNAYKDKFRMASSNGSVAVLKKLGMLAIGFVILGNVVTYLTEPRNINRLKFGYHGVSEVRMGKRCQTILLSCR